MPSLHKSFVPNEILTADDLNATCNPTVADHIPFACASGTVTVTHTNTTLAEITVQFPAGRFTRPPIVFAQAADYNKRYVYRVYVPNGSIATIGSMTASGAVTSDTYKIQWFAVQMDK